jgi:hypothetical protein
MADIRLKTITVEPQSNLSIQKGNVVISNSTASDNMLSGSLICNGGVGIYTTYNSISSTSGGALTVGGGVGIMEDVFIGGNFNLDSSTSVFGISGLSEKRLYLDNLNFYLSPDGVNKRFILTDEFLKLNITQWSSSSSTGSLLTYGGISINCSRDSDNSSYGGALTVAGGVAIGKNLNVAKNISVGESFSNKNALCILYTGENQITLRNSSGSSLSSLNMVENDLFLTNTNANIILDNNSSFGSTSNNFACVTTISNTTPSSNYSTGSFILLGGISVNNTNIATSISSGGSFTTFRRNL